VLTSPKSISYSNTGHPAREFAGVRARCTPVYGPRDGAPGEVGRECKKRFSGIEFEHMGRDRPELRLDTECNRKQ